jgi:hypothetical protein
LLCFLIKENFLDIHAEETISSGIEILTPKQAMKNALASEFGKKVF